MKSGYGRGKGGSLILPNTPCVEKGIAGYSRPIPTLDSISIFSTIAGIRTWPP
jgi:hypothetical protein